MIRKFNAFAPLILCFVGLLFFAGCGGDGNAVARINGPSDGGGGGGGGGTFGTLKWSTAIQSTPSGSAGPVITPTFISSPAIAPDGTIYVGAVDHFLYALNPNGTVKWKYETGNSLYASPAIGSDGTIYIGSEDRQIYAINPNGTLKWIVPTKSVFTSSAAIGADGTIYVAGTGQDKTIFSCISSSSCSKTINQACGTGFPPCPTDETCVAGQTTGYTVTAQLSNFYALTPNGNPKPNWPPVVTMSGVVNSSPAIASDGTIYIGSEGDFVFDRSNICDNTSVFPPSNANPNPTNGGFYPVNGHLYAINPDGTLKWDFKTLGATDSSPAIGADGTVYVGSGPPSKFYGKDQSTLVGENPSTSGFVYAINPNGTRKWVVDLFGRVDSSPAVGSEGTIYVGSDNFHVYALNPADGSTKWVEPTRDMVKSSPAIASDGTIYIGSNDKSLYAFNPDGTEKSRFGAGGSVNSGPSIGPDGTIYFSAADNKLYAVFGTTGLSNAPWPKFRHDLTNSGRQ